MTHTPRGRGVWKRGWGTRDSGKDATYVPHKVGRNQVRTGTAQHHYYYVHIIADSSRLRLHWTTDYNNVKL